MARRARGAAAGPDALRRRAEALVPRDPGEDAGLSPDEVRRALHELRVHQVELEVQNEELRRAQLELDAAHRRYLDLYDLAPIGYCTLDRSGRLRQVNLRGAELLGAPREALVGRSFDGLLAPEDRARSRRLRERLFGGGEPDGCEVRRAPGAGPEVWLALSGSLALDGDGAPEVRAVLADVTERKRTGAALEETTQQLHRLSQRVLAAQESERRRIAGELHDELGQLLTALRSNLASTRSRPERASENLQLVDDAIRQVRRLARTLRPALLDELGLEPALQWLAEQTTERGLRVEVRSHSPDLRLPPEVEAVCFRVVQEALTNIVRHAEATRVRIDMHVDGDTLVLGVKDDGRGFDPAAARQRALAGGSLGLLSMEERAVLVGGRLDVRSAPGAGTRVLLQVPVPRAPAR
jgi:PAS domain S-box-containing protein